MTVRPAHELTATEAIAAIRAGRLSAVEWCGACVAQVERAEPGLHAWVSFDGDRALAQARAVDAAVGAGAFEGRLFGAPVGVKDVFNTADFKTEMGSPIWAGFTPGNDARVVAALRLEGAVIPGKTVTAEFAVHHPGPTVNPHHPGYSPGTSSSGSAAAVAAHMVPFALGTQTAGSTIRPASYCGVYGFKPSFGVVPRTGILKTLDTLDHVAFFARSADDLELVFECARVRGENHPHIWRTLDAWSPEAVGLPLRVALVRGPVWSDAETYAQEALLKLAAEWARDADIRLEEVDLPAEFSEAHATHELIYSKALSYYFKKEYEEHAGLMSAVFREMCERGASISVEAYHEGLSRQRALQHSLDRFFDRFDLLLGLSTSAHAPKGLYGRDIRDCCLIWTLCHAPTVNLPLFRSPLGLPFGAQLVSRRYHDLFLLWAARWLHARGLAVDWPAGAALDQQIPQI